jgi:hypothetical protein
LGITCLDSTRLPGESCAFVRVLRCDGWGGDKKRGCNGSAWPADYRQTGDSFLFLLSLSSRDLVWRTVWLIKRQRDTVEHLPTTINNKGIAITKRDCMNLSMGGI